MSVSPPTRVYPLLIGSVFALLVVCGFGPAANAHQTAMSTLNVEVRPDEREVDLLLAVSPEDVAIHLELDPNEDGFLDQDELDLLKPRMAEYLASELSVENAGSECRPTHTGIVEANQAAAALLLRYTAGCDDELSEVVIENQVMLASPGGYTHYGRVQLGDDIQTTVFDRRTPTFTVEIEDDGEGFAEQSVLEVFQQYLWEGVLHILIGIDHVLFVLLLLIAARELRRLLWVITSFTLAHSITLALSALELVSLSPALVEPLIAVSIAWLAVELLLDRKPGNHLFGLSFGFGLLHGFGFSYVLRDEVGLPSETLLPALFSFNVGVELGQVMIVCLAFPLVVWARKRKWGDRAMMVLAAGVLLVSIYWFVTRVVAV